jgi:hypothetical protein
MIMVNMMLNSEQESQGQQPKGRSDPFNRLTWAGFLIVAGVVLFASQTGLLPVLGNAGVLEWIALGSGAVLIVTEVSRLFVISYSRPSTPRMIFGALLLGFGILRIFEVSEAIIGSAAIIMFGIIILVRNISR